MKKVLALALAAAMTLGAATTSFAATTYYGAALVQDSGVYFGDGATITGSDVYLNDGDGDVSLTTHADFSQVTPGSILYLPIEVRSQDGTSYDGESNVATGDLQSKLTALSDYRVGYSVDDGKNMISSIKFVLARSTDSSTKQLYLAIATEDNFIMEEQDVDLTITLTSKSDASIWNGSSYVQNDSIVLNLNFTAAYGTTEATNYFSVDSDAPIVNFDGVEDDIELYFDDDIEFHVNAYNQSDLFLRYNDSDVDAVLDEYPDAYLTFVGFDGNKKTFKRSGTLYIPADDLEGDAPYIYEIVDGKLTSVEDCTYDEDSGRFVIETKTLGNYVISDIELNTSTDDSSTDAEEEEDDASTSTGTEQNPETGANDFIGLAVALAVVSSAGIAVAKKC